MNPNLDHLERVSKALEPLLPELLFVGGTLTGLLVDDPGAITIRPTEDVDVVAQIAGYPGYQWAMKHMHELGFRSAGSPTCRWVKGDLLVDLMGTEETPFGSSNPWYAEGFAARASHRLPTSGLTIFTLTGPLFLLTKWVAYSQRGQGDMVASRDIEDLLSVMDGRRGLIDEAANASEAVQIGLRDMAMALLNSEQFLAYPLPSLAPRDDVALKVLESFRELG